ncbi:uncharacterized protein Pyn_06732 [Prunus yedoensis var. nudiflora]|uniref:Uncharacterized protein n=1 Tax=Prunus yedoensis var. nudiflora TaxID=2094558 RepID=A0A314ZFM2_PRUYE|nr:uncharacterized protein Pyn_06732 [Prunus yedoensis var. nudiflora]
MGGSIRQTIWFIWGTEFFYVKTSRTLLSVQYLCITTFQIVVEEAGSLKMKTIHSTVRSMDIQCGEWFNLVSCFMPVLLCFVYNKFLILMNSVGARYEPKEEETSLDESLSLVNHRRMAKKQAGRGIAAREPELFSVRNRKSQAS